MDFWVWVAILVIAWLIEAVASAAKKKRQPPEEAPPRPSPAPHKIYLPDLLSDPRAEEAETEQFVFEVPVRRPRRPRDAEIAHEALEGVSAEVVDAVEAPARESAGPQHVRALEKYGPALAAPAARAAARRRLVLRPATLREAVLWTEILGRPKGGW